MAIDVKFEYWEKIGCLVEPDLLASVCDILSFRPEGKIAFVTRQRKDY